jgi:hypothetical protein
MPMRLLWLAVLTGHAFAAGAWWWLLPGGFPVWHPKFWANGVLPWAFLVVAVATRFYLWERRPKWRDRVLLSFPVFWLAMLVCGVVLFPVSMLLPAIILVTPMIVALALAVRRFRPRPSDGVMMLVPVGAAAMMMLAQRGARPDTRPIAATMPSGPALPPPPEHVGAVSLAEGVKVDPGDPVVTLLSGRMTLAVQPVLTFVSRSPDRCWTLFATKAQRDGPARRLVGFERTSDGVKLLHRCDVESFSQFVWRDDAVGIQSWTTLASPVYSHLNTFTELTISGHRKLAVTFSPCPQARVEFKPFNIQGTNPSRAAYLDADGIFRVVQARTAEKGPFTTLAQGRMDRRDPLTMTLYDQDRAVFEVTLEDWAAQASVQLSPTAGYGLPVNAIEFSLDGDSARTAGGMWITLAATSVGRGWDTVGHAAGAYSNRARVRVLR